MTRDEYARLKDIVAGALAQPDTGRSAYVIARCGPDATLRIEVESLVTAALHAAPMYEEPTLLVGGSTVTIGALEALTDLALPGAPPAPHTLTSPVAAVDDEFQGTERYAVRRRIGAGGMGIVYEVDDRVRGQVVALKTLRRRNADDVYRLKREFRQLADVAHPNLVSLYDLVIDDQQCFFTMEFVDGTTFVDDARREPSGSAVADRVLRTLPQLIEGVQALHLRGLQHRDIKPSNVLVTHAGRVVLLDFGLTSGLLRDGLSGGELAGTPAYLSPEQCRGVDMTDAGDWYGVGATLYHALAGRVPFDGPVRELIARKATDDPLPVSAFAPESPDDLNGVCMALLHRNPALRLSGRDALERLSAAGARGIASHDEASETVFVGRDAALDVLTAAFAGVRAGRSASVAIYGPSGIGKSRLVRHFIDRQLEGQAVLVLRSRCHEHESIPYKALDGVIDSLTRYLSALPEPERAPLLPNDANALARLFPVLRRIGIEPDSDGSAPDPIRLRNRALVTFRELLGRIANRQPIVVDIDDFHWADADSIRWLTELLRPPSPASMLVVISFRSEELEAKPFLRSLIERVDVGERLLLPLAPMSDEEVTRLVEALLPAQAYAGAAQPIDIARDSGGNPFLVEALARHAGLGASAGGGASLAEMLTRRIDTLIAGSRAFLETLAVCGRPALPARIFEACGGLGDERPLVAQLRAARFLRNSRSAERVEMYHDRIRETLAARVSPDATRRIHELLARVLVAHGDDDPEALFEHYRAAGQTGLAATQAAAAAARASAVLAFDLAATFYRHALTLQPDAGPRTQWSAALARALENAGRPVEAADAYLDAARHAAGSDHVEWRRKAAELLLIGGSIDDGLRVIEDVLRTVGVRLARGPKTALVSLALRRLQLRWRGLDFAPRPDLQIAQEDLLRIDACWSFTVGLAMIDPIRAADFNVRQLLWALDVGDPYRIARALALEAGFSVIIPVAAAMQRSGELDRKAEALAGDVGQHYVAALTDVWAGIAAFLTGRWTEATELCGRAVTTLRDHCTGVTWELNLAQVFFLFSLLYRGELREAAGHLRGLLGSAHERGNVYLELELSTRMSLIWFAADEPVEAERRADAAIARWSQRGFQRPHYHHLLTLIQTRLYDGRARDAWQLLERHQAVLRQSQFRRVQHTRIETANYRGRCALAMAADGQDGRRMRAIAVHEAARIEREDMTWARPFAHLLRATVAYQEGDSSGAIERLHAAIEAFESESMPLYAAVCRRRLSTVVGGSRGAALRADADRWMTAQEIRNPTAFSRLIAPGLPD